MSKDLLIYTTIANRADNIKYSVLIDPETKTASFPSLVILRDGDKKELYFTDVAAFIIKAMLPALKAYKDHAAKEDQLQFVTDIFFPYVVREQSVTEMIDILEYAIENNLLTETM